jgi:oxygen-independent coproporphyrinogen-3 oxidase
MAEALMLGLRMIDGVEITHFAERFGATPAEAFAGSIRRYLDQGALEATATHLRIARRALFTADTILADIIAEA